MNRKSVCIALLIVALVTIGIWAIHIFLFPLIPKQISASAVLWASVALGAMAFLSGLKGVSDLIQSLRQPSAKTKRQELGGGESQDLSGIKDVLETVWTSAGFHSKGNIDDIIAGNVISGTVSAQNIAGHDISVHHHYYQECSHSPTPAPNVTITSLSMDESECDWSMAEDATHIRHQYMPYYMRFIEINDFVLRYDKLPKETARVFADVLERLKASLRKEQPLGNKQDIALFLDMPPDTFYKSMVLLNRLGPRLESLPDVYDVRDGLFGDEHPGDFFAYDTRAIRCVQRLVPLAWQMLQRSSSFAENGVDNAVRAFQQIFMRTTNPVFDVVLLNNASTTQILMRVEVLVEEVWSEVKAGPVAQPLCPIAHYRFALDFNKELNSFKLDPPISFGGEQAARFKLEFTDFIKGCPGNCANLRLRFVCSDAITETDTLFMDF